jgi:hypothetical protein
LAGSQLVSVRLLYLIMIRVHGWLATLWGDDSDG